MFAQTVSFKMHMSRRLVCLVILFVRYFEFHMVETELLASTYYIPIVLISVMELNPGHPVCFFFLIPRK